MFLEQNKKVPFFQILAFKNNMLIMNNLVCFAINLKTCSYEQDTLGCMHGWMVGWMDAYPSKTSIYFASQKL